MPRTGGVYSPPAGTKGVPNTTIQSVPYNTLIDDLTADANAARPVTAGGTGATSASGARAALGVEIGTNVQAYDAGLQSIAGLVTVADRMIYTTALDVYATTALTPFARDFLGDANAAAMKTRLGLAAVASSGSASDITSGTLNDARLPSTMSAKTFTGTITVGSALYQADGNIVFAGGMTVNGADLHGALARKANLSGAVFSGDVFAQALVANNALYIRNASDRNILFQTNSNVTRATIVNAASTNQIGIGLWNSSGTFVRAATFGEDGLMSWGGSVIALAANTGFAEYRWAATPTHASRWYNNSFNNTIGLQFSNDAWASNFQNLLTFDANRDATFYRNLIGTKFLVPGGGGSALAGLQTGTGDGAGASLYNVGISSWWGVGFPCLTDGLNRISIDTRNGDINTLGTIRTGNAAIFTDGNIAFAGTMQSSFGTYLSDALGRRALINNQTSSAATAYPIGTYLSATAGVTLVRNAVYGLALFGGDNFQFVTQGFSGAGPNLDGGWRFCGVTGSSGVINASFQRVS